MIALATLVSGIAVLLIGFRLYVLDRRNQTYQLFFLITILFATLHICWYELETTDDASRAFLIKRITGFWPVVKAFLFISFWFYASMDEHPVWRRFTLPVSALILLPGLFFWFAETTAYHSFGEYYLDSTTGRWMMYYSEVGWLDALMMTWKTGILLGIVWLLIKVWRSTENPYKKKWLGYTVWIVAFAVLVSLVQTIALPLYGVPSLVNEAFTITVGIFFYSWAISGFRFLDIRPEMALDHIMGSMTNVLILLNPEGLIRSVNPAAEIFFKRSGDELIGVSIESILGNTLDWKAIRASTTGRRLEAILTVEGETRFLLLNLVPVFKRRNILSGFACLGTDLSAYKNAERKVREGNIALRQSNLMLEEFIRSASHDFKEPLRTAGIYANLLYRHFPDEAQSPYHKGISLALKRMDALLNSMLEVSSLSHNTGAHQTVDLEKLVARVQNRLSPIIEKRRGTLSIRGGCPVSGDAEKLELLFHHLLQNAFQHNDKEPLNVQVNCSMKEDGMLVTIQDDGHGIPPDFQERIFHLFRRTPSGYPAGEGMGVGLTIARLIAEQHGGSIDLEYSNERGTQFQVWLPRAHENQKKMLEALEV